MNGNSVCKKSKAGGLACGGCRHLDKWELHWPNGLRRMWFSCRPNSLENPTTRCGRYELKSEEPQKGSFEGLEDLYDFT